uniref:Putative secreted protein n=1 Tax=Ixodes ricinus TaxID=34613 RepID=A0A6B0V9K6_IXORI
MPHLQLSFLLLHALQCQLVLVLKILLLLLSHDVQLLGHLDLALPLGLLGIPPELLAVFLPEGVQGTTRVPNLRQLVLQALVVLPEVLLVLEVLHQLGVHAAHREEQVLHVRVVGHRAAPGRVALQPVHKHLQRRAQLGHKLLQLRVGLRRGPQGHGHRDTAAVCFLDRLDSGIGRPGRRGCAGDRAEPRGQSGVPVLLRLLLLLPLLPVGTVQVPRQLGVAVCQVLLARFVRAALVQRISRCRVWNGGDRTGCRAGRLPRPRSSLIGLHLALGESNGQLKLLLFLKLLLRLAPRGGRRRSLARRRVLRSAPLLCRLCRRSLGCRC